MISKSHPNLRWNLRRLVARSEVSFANLQAVGLQGDRSTSQAAHLEDQRHRERRRLQQQRGMLSETMEKHGKTHEKRGKSWDFLMRIPVVLTWWFFSRKHSMIYWNQLKDDDLTRSNWLINLHENSWLSSRKTMIYMGTKKVDLTHRIHGNFTRKRMTWGDLKVI